MNMTTSFSDPRLRSTILLCGLAIGAAAVLGAPSSQTTGEDRLEPPDSPMFFQDVAWSPDGEWLAFSRYTAEGDDYDPANWQVLVARADGSALAFTSDRDGNSEIYVLSLEAEAEPRRLTFDDADDHNPVWSPDGESLVLYRAVNGGSADQVYRISADGSQEWRLTNDQHLNIFPGFLADGRISWTRKSADSGAGRLMIFDPDTATAAPAGAEGAFFGPWGGPPGWYPRSGAGHDIALESGGA